MRDKLTIILFYSVLIVFLLLGIFTKDKLVSTEERRILSSVPKPQIETLLNGEYSSNLDTYLLDQFPLREGFRNLKGVISNNILLKKENNSVYETNNHLVEVTSSIDYNSLDYFISKVNYVKDEYFSNNNLYFMIIPDKNYYISDKLLPKINYEDFDSYLKSNLRYFKFIDVYQELTLDSYYKSDIHWKQDKLENVVRKLEKEMNLKRSSFPKEVNKYSPFYGALYSKTVSNVKNDEIIYLSSDIINSAKVYNYEKSIYDKVYNKSYLDNIDKYDIFLGGASPLLIINNENNTTNKELIIFRDSFGSSITPLLIENYSKITVIDLRYISSKYLKNVSIDFNDKDILFMYSISVMNNSYSIK